MIALPEGPSKLKFYVKKEILKTYSNLYSHYIQILPYALIIYIYMKVKLLVLKTEALMSDKNCQTVKLDTP